MVQKRKMKKQKKNSSKLHTVLFWGIIAIIYLLSVIINAVCDWFNMRFGVGFEEILFTITSPMEGSDVSFLGEAVEYVLQYIYNTIPILLIVVLIIILFKCVSIKISFQFLNKRKTIHGYMLYKLVCCIVAIVLLASALSYGFVSLDLGTYITRRVQRTTIYEDCYVNPATASISLEGSPQNIIYIYLESMETTYASIEDGGAQEQNYIPKLTKLANENVSFSDTEVLGGAYVPVGSSWTMGALFSITSGVPFEFPVGCNSMGAYEEFAPGITSLGDILEDYGYNQVFLCGSDGNFAGRQKYFEQHGNYEVKDYYYAIEKGYIDEDYFVWWGYEDAKLYEIAKAELLEIAKKDEPFNFTMLTVDTHHIDGYVCANCGQGYDHQLKNVLECTDNQIDEFILWCKQQEFYEDTVIVISGDHFRMDSSLVADKERRLYNCIINSECEILGETSNRIFTSLDLFPTTLAAMGFKIEGDRLGLGTNLFSDRQTLAEELGVDYFINELSKYSDYYVEEFE